MFTLALTTYDVSSQLILNVFNQITRQMLYCPGNEVIWFIYSTIVIGYLDSCTNIDKHAKSIQPVPVPYV